MSEAIGAVLTPIAVAVLVYVLSKSQSRSEELVRARLEYYKMLAPDLNLLMCYITFIGGWRDESPVEVVALKRRLDMNFHCAAPLFSSEVADAYNNLMRDSFSIFGRWGIDARIKSSAYRRRQAWTGTGENAWQSDWDSFFALRDSDTISGESLTRYRKQYDLLLALAAKDISLTRARTQYTTDLVSLNAHAPRAQDIRGSSGQS